MEVRQRFTLWGRAMKRLSDILVSAFLLVCLAPLMLIISLTILAVMGRPLLFCQLRPGLHGKPFEILKFRSMCEHVDNAGVKLADAQRLTAFGKFLRSTSMDELPELWNVLKGDMSLVGPRPLLMKYLPLYSQEQARRHEVRPGVTGWAQVNGRNAISWQERFKLDVWYVDNQSIALDIKILLITVKKVLLREGISADNHATVEGFKGNG